MKPVISVCLLSWNHINYIEQCLLSVINQTFKNFEIIYLDNSSTDGTFQKAEAILKSTDISFKLLQNKEAKSLTQNANLLFSEAKGDLVTILSTDDWLTVDSLYEKVKYYNKHNHLGLIYTSGWYYYEDKNVFEELSVKSFRSGNVFEELLENNFVFTPGAVIKRNVIKEVGQWDESLNVEDYDMWLRIAEKYEIGFIAKPLVYYRRHSGSFSQFNNLNFLESVIRIYEKHKHRGNPKVDEKLLYYKHYYMCALSEKKLPFNKVTSEFLKYFTLNRKYIRPYVSYLLKKAFLN